MPGKKNEANDKGMAKGAAAGAQQSGQQNRNPMYDEDLDRRDDQNYGSAAKPEQGRAQGGYDEKQPGKHNRDQLGRRDD
jgi:hypothetical protein